MFQNVAMLSVIISMSNLHHTLTISLTFPFSARQFHHPNGVSKKCNILVVFVFAYRTVKIIFKSVTFKAINTLWHEGKKRGKINNKN